MEGNEEVEAFDVSIEIDIPSEFEEDENDEEEQEERIQFGDQQLR